MQTLALLGPVLTLGFVVAQGCAITAPDPLHCGNNEGNGYCAAQFPDGSRPFCELGAGACISPESELGCVSERPVDECYSPCGGRSTIDFNGECVMDESSTGSSGTATDTEASSSSGSESSTTGPMPCAGDEDCSDAAAPFCEPSSGECVRCDGTDDPDGACAGVDPGLPLCAGGACVQCTGENAAACTGETPVCDEATNTCVPCTAHDQCGGAGCNLFIGACLPVNAVVHVGGPKPDFSTLGEAVASFGAEEEGTIVVHQAMASYDEAVTLSAGRVIAFLVPDDLDPKLGPPRWVQTSGATPQLTVAAGTTVLVDGLELSGNLSSSVPGILVNGGRAWLDRTRVVQNSGGGIVAQSNAELVLRNCFVGTEVSNLDTVIVSDAMASIVYTTIVAGDGGLGQSRAVFCGMGSNLAIRNSLLLAIDDVPEVECSTADISYSATETAIAGEGNATLGNLELGWLMDETSDFHLDTPPPIIATTARWTTEDPPADIDGDPRPAIDGSPDYAGADVP
jgi:hypothetical protein